MKIIAELGTCTNGDLNTALRMVDAAAKAGCDGVKVQAYETRDFLPSNHPDWEMFENARLSWPEIEMVRMQAVQNGLLFGGTPTSIAGVEFLAEIGADFLKNGSDFLLRHDLIQAMLNTGIETWVALGMADEEEYLRLLSQSNVNLMACTSAYPCPDEEAHLMRLLRSYVRGYSDHTTGTTAAVMAATLGATMFELHVTLSAASASLFIEMGGFAVTGPIAID